jgi:two-component system, OmpR family, sensor histidine kinase KdpD
MSDVRKTAEEILAKIKEEEQAQTRGHLKIFLGASAGVGKTYSMLEDARKLLKDGVDVVGGVVVTHGRKETELLLEGVPLIPAKVIEYKTAKLSEFNLDAVLERKPEVVLVDELAHTNAPGCRHEKRWQDVDELLQAGIDVVTTVNIQHLESVNDLVAQITGVQVRETIPDSVFENADVIELVDLPPDELIVRLKEGKIYIPETASAALENFFKKGNLIALRELALRVTAERVDAEMLKYRQNNTVKDVWPIAGRFLVCVGPSPLSARLVRATKRMSGQLRAEWIAAYVETANSARLSEKDRQRVTRTLRLAQQLGAQTCRLSGNNAAEELVAYARKINASHIVIGKPARPRWREILFGSVVDDLIRQSGNIDVYVISGDQHDDAPSNGYIRSRMNFSGYLASVILVAVATAFSAVFSRNLERVNLVMVYFLVIVIVGVKFGKGPSVLAALLSVGAFDFFFVPPYLSFAISDTQYLITFLVMLFVGLTVSSLTSALKQQETLSRLRERHTATLYAMAREQASAGGTKEIVDISLKHISEVMEAEVVLFLSNKDHCLYQVSGEPWAFPIDSKEIGVAQWVFVNKQPAGATTATLSGARALYVPLVASHGVIGVIGVLPHSYERFSVPDEIHLFETLVNQTALAVERALLEHINDS